MTNSYDVGHGLSQDAPGPLEPVEIAQQPGAAPATGNTARDQEMYAAGIRTGEENTKHNAAIRAGVPDGWKLVPIEPTDAMLDAGIKQHRCEQGDPWYSSPDLGEGDCRDIYAAMLNAAPSAPGVSTVEDAQAVAWMEPGIDVPVTNEYRNKTPLRQAKYCVPLYKHAPVNAPAAGDALDVARYRWLCDKFGITKLPCAIERIIEGSYVPDGKNAIDAAIDAAIAAQRKGDA
ncbi:hypothetical protein ACOTEY_00475 [Achromobacter xylosoxidans]